MAMAYWGVALALGSNHNLQADAPQLREAYANVQKALALAGKAPRQERAYIEALAKRYSNDPQADRQKLALDYKNAMGELVKRYRDDLDAATLYAESMMNLRPWKLWTPDGKPAEGTEEIIAVLEGVLGRNPNHTGANHYYIHAVEASSKPERDLPVRELLGGALLLSGDYIEAEKVFRAEIAKHPRNGRALFGLVESLKWQGKGSSAQMVQREFERARETADTKITVADVFGIN